VSFGYCYKAAMAELFGL